jgi:hypothetical protein
MVTKKFCDRCNREILASTFSGSLTIYDKGTTNQLFDLCDLCFIDIRHMIKQGRKR